MKKKKPIRCSGCGRFISYKAMEEGKVIIRFTPDTHFTAESTEYECEKCIEKEEPWENQQKNSA